MFSLFGCYGVVCVLDDTLFMKYPTTHLHMILIVPVRLLRKGVTECETLSDMINGTAMIIGTHSMSFKCNSGYNLLGSEKIQCENGVWTNVPPTCLPARKEYSHIE